MACRDILGLVQNQDEPARYPAWPRNWRDYDFALGVTGLEDEWFLLCFFWISAFASEASRRIHGLHLHFLN